MSEAGWMEWRRICMEKYKVSYDSKLQCPICMRWHLVKSMDCHHLIPKNVAPHLIYSDWNLIFLCHTCHHTIHLFMDGSKTKTIDILPKGLTKEKLYETALKLKGYIERFGPPKSEYHYLYDKIGGSQQ